MELIEFERKRRIVACEELTSSVLLNHLKKKRVTNELRIEDAVVSSAVGDEGSASKKRKLMVHQDSQHYQVLVAVCCWRLLCLYRIYDRYDVKC